MKKSLVHNTSVARQQGTKLEVGIAAISGFELFSSDVIHVYLQSSENLMRDIYLNASRELNKNLNRFLNLLKPF